MKPLPYIAAALCLAVTFSPLIAETELRVDGIMSEDQIPDESLAVVNGVPLQTGDSIQDYQVKSIQKNSVTFVSKTGEEKTVPLLEPRSVPPAPSIPEEKTPPPLPSPAKEEPAQKNSLLSGFNMPDIMGKISGLTVMIDLKNIYTSATIHMAETGNIPTVQSLVEAGQLNPIFETGVKGNYAFEIKPGAKGDPVVYADPIPGKESLPHFMMDEWGNLREEKGKRATAKSPLFHN